jgi:hypothetical protein
MTDRTGDAERGVVVRMGARETLRSMRPMVRVVLEDVALDAAWRDGRLVASTSARLVAEHVGVDAGTAASALRVLRERGLVELVRSPAPGGRFGLSAYAVSLPDGIDVIGPPRAARLRAASPHSVEHHAASATDGRKRRARATRASHGAEQGALDLGLGER